MMVDIILVNWKGWRDTLECLESVFRLDYPRFRVIVVDNGSGDGSLERIADWAAGRLPAGAGSPALAGLSSPPLAKPLPFVVYDRAQAEAGGAADDPQLVLIQSGGNLGFAGGNNVGLRYAMRRPGFGHAWLLNNDTVVEPGALAALARRAAEAPSAGIVGSTLLFYGAPAQVQAYGGARFKPARAWASPIGLLSPRRALAPAEVAAIEAEMAYVIGASMLVSAAFLRDVGLMEESYFLYYEEIDWARRGAAGRYTLAYAPDSVVYHKVGQSAGTESLMSQHFLYRSRLRFMRRHYRSKLPLTYAALLWEAAKALLKGRHNQWRAIAKVMLRPDAWPAGPARPVGH